MSILSITVELHGEHHVWIQLEPGHPERQSESFILGSGNSSEAALVEARRELERLIITMAKPESLQIRRV